MGFYSLHLKHASDFNGNGVKPHHQILFSPLIKSSFTFVARTPPFSFLSTFVAASTHCCDHPITFQSLANQFPVAFFTLVEPVLNGCTFECLPVFNGYGVCHYSS
ncbi:hypothetical protein Hdeb2414_s0008g00264821 [Helianthus debilis subsp. tardiflorus]